MPRATRRLLPRGRPLRSPAPWLGRAWSAGSPWCRKCRAGGVSRGDHSPATSTPPWRRSGRLLRVCRGPGWPSVGAGVQPVDRADAGRSGRCAQVGVTVSQTARRTTVSATRHTAIIIGMPTRNTIASYVLTGCSPVLKGQSRTRYRKVNNDHEAPRRAIRDVPIRRLCRSRRCGCRYMNRFTRARPPGRRREPIRPYGVAHLLALPADRQLSGERPRGRLAVNPSRSSSSRRVGSAKRDEDRVDLPRVRLTPAPCTPAARSAGFATPRCCQSGACPAPLWTCPAWRNRASPPVTGSARRPGGEVGAVPLPAENQAAADPQVATTTRRIGHDRRK